jgi:hypothetical protein
MTRIINLAAAAAMAAAALMSLSALGSSRSVEKEGPNACAAALCGIVIF